MEEKTLNIYCDGGARGNPGPAAVGVVIKNITGETIEEISKFIGNTTNNSAEYQAVIEALKFLQKNNLLHYSINFYLDSKIVASQLGGVYKIKQPHLLKFYLTAQKIISETRTTAKFNFIKREYNREADSLVNQALDTKIHF